MDLVRKLKALFSLTLRPFRYSSHFQSVHIMLGTRSTIFITGVQFRELIIGNINLERTRDVLAVDFLKNPIKVRLI